MIKIFMSQVSNKTFTSFHRISQKYYILIFVLSHELTNGSTHRHWFIELIFIKNIMSKLERGKGCAVY